MTAEEKYKALIKYRSKHKLEKGHKHHIIPRCMNPPRNKCIILTLQEHTLAHYWLMQWFKKVPKYKKYIDSMSSAFKGLRNQWIYSICRWRFKADEVYRRFEANYVKRFLTCPDEFVDCNDFDI